MPISSRSTRSKLLAASCLTFWLSQTGAVLADSADASGDGLQEVLVTARKRTERAQDVPIGLTRIDGEYFSDADHYRIDEINQLAPSVNIVIPTPHQTAFSVRGIGNNIANDGLEQSAGLFLDGVYLGRPGMAVLDLIDLQGIEVLRGPQGTLFGKNTTAGALSISTLKPSFTFGGAAQLTEGNYGFQQYQGMVTGPLTQDLAVRLTAYDTQRNGWVMDTTNGDRVGNQSRAGMRGQLLYQPADNLSIRLIGEIHQEDDNPQVSMFNSLGPTPSAVQAKLAAANAVIDVDPSGSLTSVDGFNRTRSRQYALSTEIDWSVGGYDVTSISAFRSWYYSHIADGDGTSAPAIEGGDIITDRQYSQELRVATPVNQPVSLVGGLYFYDQDLKHDQPSIFGSAAPELLSGLSAPALAAYAKYSPQLQFLTYYANSDWDVWSTPTIRSYGAFAQGVWHAADQLDVTLGVRETYERKSERVWRPAPISTVTGQPVAALASQAYNGASVGLADWSPSGLLSVSYKPTDKVMAYISASHGEKAGGLNSNIPGSGLSPDSLKVAPEKADDAEIGVKSESFNHHLQLNADAFVTLVRDYQTTYFTTPPGGASAIQVLANAGALRTQGFELEAVSRPVAGLTIDANGSYNNAYYQAYGAAPCPQPQSASAVCSLTGRPVNGAPRWITNVSATYERQLWLDHTAYVGGEWSWRSSYFGYLDDSPYTLTGGFAIANLRFGVREDNRGWDLSFWVKNLFDRRYVSSYINLGSLLPGIYSPFFGDRQTFGGTLRVSF